MADWVENLDLIEFTYNDSKNSSTRFIPSAHGGGLFMNPDDVLDMIQKRAHVLAVARENMRLAQGPFEIMEKLTPVSYRLKFPASMRKYHDVLHTMYLKKFHKDDLVLLEHMQKWQPAMESLPNLDDMELTQVLGEHH
ncbi:hypothetical protein R1flu_004263 [Riccia fluitans]|uniref:Tf2-1-like SH3-like domain-containing protein n=1 Tax=Riccia fluitans TaxID=41844 RepID=A0ABD1YSR3_9MARC